ncbi:MAG: PH domain-containing protein, partial [Acidimicrobiales bacterium]|nr:PH domain-containing protein [Acidimicrobiales bacterium]
MAFPRNLLNDKEELVLDLRPHWFFLAKPVVCFVGSLILTILSLVVWDPSGTVGDVVSILCAVLVLGTLLFLVWEYLVWTSTMFVLTSDRIVSRRGVLTKSGVEIPLERINTVFFQQGVFERIIGSGDLAIESAGERGTETFNDVRKPSVVQKEIYVQMEA